MYTLDLERLGLDWPRYQKAAAKLAKLNKRRRELGTRVAKLEEERRTLVDGMADAARNYYADALEDGDANPGDRMLERLRKSYKRVPEINRELELLRVEQNGLKQAIGLAEGALEAVQNEEGPEKAKELADSVGGAVEVLESILARARESAYHVGMLYDSLLRLTGNGDEWGLPRVGVNGKSFGHCEDALFEADARARQIRIRTEQCRQAAERGQGVPVPAVGEGTGPTENGGTVTVTQTRSGTVGYFLPDE